jgi:hypothetical protein
MLATATTRDDLTATVAPILLGQGWRTDEGPITERNVDAAVGSTLSWWRVLSMLHEVDLGRPTSLTESGATTVLAYLRQRAAGPRHGVFD